VTYIPREHGQPVLPGDRGNRYVWKARVAAGGHCFVRDLTGQTGRGSVKSQDLRSISEHQLIQPPCQVRSPSMTAPTPQFANSLLDLRNGYGRKE